MASNGPITVADNAAANHVLSPVAIKDGSIATYQDLSQAVHSARDKASISHRESSVVRTVNVDERIPRTVTETVNGVPVTKVVDFATLKTTMIAPLTWDDDACANARVRHSNMLKSDVVRNAYDNAEFVW